MKGIKEVKARIFRVVCNLCDRILVLMMPFFCMKSRAYGLLFWSFRWIVIWFFWRIFFFFLSFFFSPHNDQHSSQTQTPGPRYRHKCFCAFLTTWTTRNTPKEAISMGAGDNHKAASGQVCSDVVFRVFAYFSLFFVFSTHDASSLGPRTGFRSETCRSSDLCRIYCLPFFFAKMFIFSRNSFLCGCRNPHDFVLFLGHLLTKTLF